LLAGFAADAKNCKKACETYHRNFTVTYNYSWSVPNGTQGCPKPQEGRVKYTKTMTNHKNGVTVVVDSGYDVVTAMC
jgi:hypothetical protein